MSSPAALNDKRCMDLHGISASTLLVRHFTFKKSIVILLARFPAFQHAAHSLRVCWMGNTKLRSIGMCVSIFMQEVKDSKHQ